MRTELAEGEEVRVFVVDRGCGIPPEKMERIFEAFFTTKKNGMGLGLGISLAIISAHGGTLSATNNDEGGCELSVHATHKRGRHSGSSESGDVINRVVARGRTIELARVRPAA